MANAESLTLGLGSNAEGRLRREYYEKAAIKELGLLDKVLSKWARVHLDKASGFERAEKQAKVKVA